MNFKGIVTAILIIGLSFVARDTFSNGSCKGYAEGPCNVVVTNDEDSYIASIEGTPLVNDKTRCFGKPILTSAIRFLAREADMAAFFLRFKGTRLDDPRFDIRWRCQRPEECISSILESDDLIHRKGSNGLMVIGDEGILSIATVVVYAYSINKPEDIEAYKVAKSFESALFSELPIGFWSGSDSFQWLGLGYYWIPEEPNSVIVMASFGYSTDEVAMGRLRSRIYKVNAERIEGEWAISCVWGERGSVGLLAREISEDFDGDGVRDYVFVKPDAYYPDFILSGSGGRELAQFSTQIIAVEKVKGKRTRRFAVKHEWRSEPSFDSRIFTYSENKGSYILDNPVKSGIYRKNVADEKGIVHGKDTAVVFGSKIGDPKGDNMRVYVLPKMRKEKTPENAEVIELSSSESWRDWVVTNNPMKQLTEKNSDDGVRVLYTYFPEGFDQKRPYSWYIERF
jgi:hypothetical protein